MKRFIALFVVIVMALSMVVACGPTEDPTPDPNAAETPDPNGDENPTDTPVSTPDPTIVRPTEYVPGDDGEIYEAVLGEYEAYCNAAKEAATIDERFVLFAKAEAYLLESAVMIPTTTEGGAYTISRVAYRTIPYVQWGNDDDRLKGLIISDEFITKEERAELKAMWEKAVAGEGP